MAHYHFKDVAAGRWRLGGGSNDGQFMSSTAADELGPSEMPPKGLSRRCGFRLKMLCRRVWAEVKLEWPLAKPRLWVIIPLLIFQYVHAIFTGMAYYMHTPLPEDNTTLHDLGFEVFPYLSVDAVSEVLVYGGFAGFFIWALSPFVTRRKSFHFVVVLKRVLVVLVLCQVLRIATFLSTQLPAPAPHCRAPEPTSNVPWPVWWRVIIVDVARQASKGCGDLIFSSHITFLLTFMWTYTVMGQYLLLKVAAFLYTLGTAFCIIASRKHYTVDITVAYYVVPLVFFHFCRKWSTTRDDIATNDNRGILPLGPSLPVTSLPSHGGGAGGGGSLAVNNRSGSGSKVGSDGASRHQSASALGSYGGGLGTGSAGSGEEVRLDMELAQRASSAPLVLDEVQRPPSPVKQAVRKAWDALSDLPGKAGRAAGVTPSSHHRRTESMEPVLLGEDQSASSLGS